MKLSFEKSALLNGINIAMKAVPSRTTMPILECILIDASDEEIKLTANDMELGIETKVAGTILEPGKIAIEAKLLSEIVRKFPDSQVFIEADENYNVVLDCEKSKFKIAGKSGDEFSYLPYIERDRYISLSQFTLKEMIRQTIFSIAQGESNKQMTGELFEVRDDFLRMISLDGHRISIRRVKLKDHYEDEKVIVPGKTLSEVSKILSGDSDKEIVIYFTGNHILFEFDDTIVVSRLIEGQYFNVDQMISNDYETKVSLNKREFLDTIERSMLLIRENDKKPLILTVGENNMEAAVKSAIGSLKEDILIRKEGKDITIGFNPKFLIDALRVIDDEEVDMYMVNSKAPCFIRDGEGAYLYLILPVNI